MTSRATARHETSAGGVVFHRGAGRHVYLVIRDSYQNWGFPKGHLEHGEEPDVAAIREVGEETGLTRLHLRGAINRIDWTFRFRGQLIHKSCYFFLMETAEAATAPQRTEGITACRWVEFDEAVSMISYGNARGVLRRAQEMVLEALASA